MARLSVYLLVMVVTLTATTSTRGDTSNKRVSQGSTVNRLLHYYERGEPPSTDRATAVKLGVYINSFSVSERSMDYSVSMYLRQAWRDPRLVFEPTELVSDIKLEYGKWNEIWIPDTYMRDELGASFHAITVPNRLMKLNATGHVWYVSKITTRLSCSMNLRMFPFDTQICPMRFESFGNTMKVLYYDWLDIPVELDEDVQAEHFTMQSVMTAACSRNYTTGYFSCVEIRFSLKRDISRYVLLVYLPSMVLVLLSWLTFWLHADKLVARLILLLIPVLCMTHMWYSIQDLMPRVSYIKAIDFWMLGCGLFVFAAIVEAALVSMVAKKPGRDDSDDDVMDKQVDGLIAKVRWHFSRGWTNASKIDMVSRVAFPVCFLIFNIIYWIACSA